MYGMHTNTVYQWIKTGKLSALKVGRGWRIPATALEAFDRENAFDPRSRCFRARAAQDVS
jgi:excisionase family DNA binding protein